MVFKINADVGALNLYPDCAMVALLVTIADH
jgi:hypothetical protein